MGCKFALYYCNNTEAVHNVVAVRDFAHTHFHFNSMQQIKPASHIKICVVDTGYDLGHDDLPTENVTGWDPSSDEDPGFGVWYVDGEDGHGTHVAGTIGAIGGNNGELIVYHMILLAYQATHS